MNGPKLMLFGYARHGKDTVAEILTRNFGVRCVASSWFAAERIMWPHFRDNNIKYASVQDCFDDRVNYRKDWFDQIAAYNAVDLCHMAREIFAEHDVYVGIRNDREFNQAKCEGLFDFGVWVDRSNHLPPEPTSSNKMQPWHADFILDNNGTLAELEDRACKLYRHLRALKA